MAPPARSPAVKTWLVQFRAEIAAASDPAEELAAYRAAWETGNSPAMSPEVFRRVVFLPHPSRWVASIASLPPVNKTLRAPASFLARSAERDEDVLRAVAAVLAAEELFIGLDPDAIERRWDLLRTGALLAAADRGRVAEAAVTGCVRSAGKEWVRERLSQWWPACALEEEREGILKAADASGVVLSPLVLAELGPEAERLHLALGLQTPASTLSGVLDDLHLAPAQLLRPVVIRTDVRDSRLSARERARVAPPTRPARGTPVTPEVQALVDGAAHRADWRGLPLIRLLHLRHLLDAPAFNPSQEVHEDGLRALLHFFARENGVVDYWPEVRMSSAVGRRWRARWAEVMGEAIAIAFLDAALLFDFATLTRVPESTDPTPDFTCLTTAGAHLAFEAKGTASKKTHDVQRKRALVQLGKAAKAATGSRGSGRKTFRPFACSFMVGSEHGDPSTLLHVADPPGDFDALFPEGWEAGARRTHLAAVCEAAQLYSLADRVLLVDAEALQERTESIVLPVGDEGMPCVGTELSLGREARRLGIDLVPAMKDATLFVGVEARVHQQLTIGVGRYGHLDLPSKEGGYGLVTRNGEVVAFSWLPNGSVFAVRVALEEGEQGDG
jgi:hypothetical protein